MEFYILLGKYIYIYIYIYIVLYITLHTGHITTVKLKSVHKSIHIIKIKYLCVVSFHFHLHNTITSSPIIFLYPLLAGSLDLVEDSNGSQGA